ncbi:MAG: zinc-ribbon domain-containing protein [Chloroflexi bacterium]|nr:MAG: zinc-ribbon domain-containing protein [Chloroflexota bacterium]
MALTCARCGAQNPDGNLYCQSCGTSLTAPAATSPSAIPVPPPGAAPPGPPPGIAPPVAGPAGYQSPYYAPSGATVPVHRTPWMLIIAGVVALTVVMAGCGTALAILGNRSSNNTSGGGIADVPSPTPAATPSPVASPTSNSTGPKTESNDSLTLTVATGWTVDNKDAESITLLDPNSDGTVTAASGPSIPPQTAQNNKDTIDSQLKSQYSDTRECPNTSPSAGTFNGASGIAWTLCFTITSGGNSIPAAASLFAGANNSGSVYYVIMVLTSQSNLQNLQNQAKPVLQSVHWKLS